MLFQGSELMNVVASVDGEKVWFSDSSYVQLKAGSGVKYSEVFDEENRLVELSGEGFFQVSRDTLRPFIIHTLTTQITVLGTSFNVKEENEEVEVVVNTGKVEFLSTVNKDQKVQLTRGQIATINTVKSSFVPSKKPDPMAHFWATKTLVFDRVELQEVVEVVNTVYNSNIELSSDNIRTCKLTATFKDKSSRQILRVISATLGLEVVEEGNRQILKGERCN